MNNIVVSPRLHRSYLGAVLVAMAQHAMSRQLLFDYACTVSHDATTGLLNRSALLYLLQRIPEEEYPVMIDCADVVGLKNHNKVSWEQGSLAIKTLGHAAEAAVRSSGARGGTPDIVGRYGGDEILIALPYAPARSRIQSPGERAENLAAAAPLIHRRIADRMASAIVLYNRQVRRATPFTSFELEFRSSYGILGSREQATPEGIDRIVAGIQKEAYAQIASGRK